jgi:hypothetical protein
MPGSDCGGLAALDHEPTNTKMPYEIGFVLKSGLADAMNLDERAGRGVAKPE